MRPPPRLRRWATAAGGAPWLPVAAYLGYVGADGFANRSRLDAFLPDWLGTVWSAALLTGAALVILGTITARTRAESAGHGLHVAGIVLYAACYATSLNVNAVAAILTLGGVAAIRLHVLSQARAARQVAGELIGPPQTQHRHKGEG